MVITGRYVAKKKVVSNIVKTAILYPGLCIEYMIYDIYWLVVWNIFIHFPYFGNFIIPTDFHIFQRGRSTTKQCIYIYIGS